jgi:Flp pilus assembly protein TadB
VSAALLGTAVALVVGDLLRRVPAGRHPSARLAVDAPRHRRTATIVLVLASGLLVPVLPAALVLGGWTWRRHRRRRARVTAADDVRRALPEVVDLLALATTAGLSLPVAHPLVADGAPPPLGSALAEAHRATLAGRARSEALLDHLAPLGERSRALADVLVDHLRYGVPLLPALERTSLELRLDRRRAAELDARRVPVRLLAPLVSCVLPAFALLTVVPLLAASLRALPT